MRFIVRVSVGLLVSCASIAQAGAAATASGSSTLDGTAWVLAALVGRQVLGSPVATLQFDAGRVSGTDGCNRFDGSYSATGPSFEVAPQLASTQMACPPEVEAKARAFIEVLVAARAWRIDGARLLLLSADGTTLATLAVQSLLLMGTSWHATGINNGRQAVESIVNGTLVTLSFGGEGDASGSGGCNHYSGHYDVAGSRISIGNIAVTTMACAEPPGVMEQEQAFLKALAAATAVRFEGERLDLRMPDGALAASFVRAPGG
jgi:heat shock protein HslJ